MNSLVKAKILSNAPSDIRYQIGKIYKFGDIQFDSPALEILTHYYSLLKSNSQIIPMSERYEYRPDYVSYDFYNTTNLWFMILYLNSSMGITHFNKQNLSQILVPDRSIVYKLLSKYSQRPEIEDILNNLKQMEL